MVLPAMRDVARFLLGPPPDHLMRFRAATHFEENPMIVRTLIASSILLLVASSAWACDKHQAAPAPAPATEAAPPAAADAAPALDAYEAMRAALAADDLAAAKAAAKKLSVAAKGAKGHVAHAGMAAAGVSGAADMAAARLAFGETSKALISAIADHPDLGKGLHAFTCPMAKGYKKWLERTKDFQNPYMGKKMLKCGGPTDMKV